MHGLAWLVLGIPAAFAAASAAADPPAPDTSDWKCTQCPFLQGYAADAQVGVIGASGANDTFGRYTGIDHGGAYADAAASGQFRNDDGTYANYDLERLGLDSRDGYVDGGREGRYDVRVSYQGQPNLLYDTGATPFKANGSNVLLPVGLGAGGQHRRHERAGREPHAHQYRIGAPHRRAAGPLLRHRPAGRSSANFAARSMTARESPARAS